MSNKRAVGKSAFRNFCEHITKKASRPILISLLKVVTFSSIGKNRAKKSLPFPAESWPKALFFFETAKAV